MAKIRWPWSKPTPLPIPKFRPEFKRLEPKDPDIIVTEEELSQTGLWRLFPHKKPKDKL